MNNLQISDNDLMGKRFNGHDLHIYLRELNIESNSLVWKKKSKDINTYEIGEQFSQKVFINDQISEIEKRLSVHGLLYPFSYEMLSNRLFLETDIVHYHLIHNSFFNLLHMPILTSLKPAVWTLHDPWALTGHCIHPHDCDKWKIGCGDCHDLNMDFRLLNDSTAINWEIKKNIYKQSNFDVIVASEWMSKMVSESPLFEDKRIHLIPFGLDLSIFKQLENNGFRKNYNIPNENIIISFRAQSWKLKGLDYIKECLNRLNTDKSITLLTFNTKGLMDEFKKKYQVVDLGWVDNESELVEAYNAADIFLMPSTAESFGVMAMEAMSCGKPVIVFEDTALENTVFAPKGGVAVPKGNVGALTEALKRLIENENERICLGEEAVKLAILHYNAKDYVKKIIEVYKEVIDKRKTDSRKNYIIEQQKKSDFVIMKLDAEKYNSENTSINSGDMKLIHFIELIKRLISIKFIRIIVLLVMYPILNLFYNFYLKFLKKG